MSGAPEEARSQASMTGNSILDLSISSASQNAQQHIRTPFGSQEGGVDSPSLPPWPATIPAELSPADQSLTKDVIRIADVLKLIDEIKLPTPLPNKGKHLEIAH